ncbi:MAG TPA: hypothetical protein VME24_01660, partial [Alphaproteobacteria bacterium]|nr:hypothetical protein [Alphaproteobacteria bacterium]
MKPLRKPIFGVFKFWKRDSANVCQTGRVKSRFPVVLVVLLACVFTLLPPGASIAQTAYVGNTLEGGGPEDGDPPLVILGEYNPTSPSSNSTVTLPAGAVEDVRFFSGTNYNFTLYALAWAGNGLNTNEQTFQVAAEESFTSNNAVAGFQTNLLTGFQVRAGDLLAFQGLGPDYVNTGLDATYESMGFSNPFTATNAGNVGTTFTVGINGDPNASYEYIPAGGDISANRTYAIGVDVLSITNGYSFIQIAGQGGNNGYLNGYGTNSLFNNAEGTAVASNFDVFVADTANNRIREVSTLFTNWLVTTIAGSNTAGHADGTSTNAQFNAPQGIAVTSNETVFVADTLNDTIRMLTLTNNTNWAVSTIAGTIGITGTNDGTNYAGYFAKFDGPEAIAVDIHTNLFVADTTNDTIREITLTNGNWVVTTIAGMAKQPGHADGTNGGTQFNLPGGIAVDMADNLYVADSANNEIRKITPQGPNWVVTTIAGTNVSSGSVDGTGTSARFNYPGGIAVDTFDDLFVTDTSNNTVRVLVPWGGGNWRVNTIGGTNLTGYANGVGSGARFTNPRGISVNGVGDLFLDEDVVMGGIAPLSTWGNAYANYNVQLVVMPAAVDGITASSGGQPPPTGNGWAEWTVAGTIDPWVAGETAGVPSDLAWVPTLPATSQNISILFTNVPGWKPPAGKVTGNTSVTLGTLFATANV